MVDLAQFALSDMTACGAALRKLVAGARFAHGPVFAPPAPPADVAAPRTGPPEPLRGALR